MQARRGWKQVFKVMKSKDSHPRLLYPAKLSFRMEGQLKRFPDEVKFKTMNSKMTTNSNYQQLNLKKKNKQKKTSKLEQ